MISKFSHTFMKTLSDFEKKETIWIKCLINVTLLLTQKISKDTHDSGSTSLALFGSVSPINDLQPSTAPSLDSTKKQVGPLK